MSTPFTLYNFTEQIPTINVADLSASNMTFGVGGFTIKTVTGTIKYDGTESTTESTNIFLTPSGDNLTIPKGSILTQAKLSSVKPLSPNNIPYLHVSQITTDPDGQVVDHLFEPLNVTDLDGDQYKLCINQPHYSNLIAQDTILSVTGSPLTSGTLRIDIVYQVPV